MTEEAFTALLFLSHVIHRGQGIEPVTSRPCEADSTTELSRTKHKANVDSDKISCAAGDDRRDMIVMLM